MEPTSLSKVAGMLCRSLVLIETPELHFFFRFENESLHVLLTSYRY